MFGTDVLTEVLLVPKGFFENLTLEVLKKCVVNVSTVGDHIAVS